MVLSLSAKGLTHGEISAHLAEVYGAEISKSTISTITDSVMAGMTEWQNRPLDSVYPVVFIDCVNVKVRDGQVANRPVRADVARADHLPRTGTAMGDERRATSAAPQQTRQEPCCASVPVDHLQHEVRPALGAQVALGGEAAP
jgi:hypothetical protein